MNIKQYNIPFSERLQFNWVTDHWVEFTIITLLCLVFATATPIAIKTAKNKKDRDIRIIITAVSSIMVIALSFILLDQLYRLSHNTDHYRYMSYEGQGEVTNVKQEYVYKGDKFSYPMKKVTFKSDLKTYQIVLDIGYDIKKGDKIKLSSNGKLPARDKKPVDANNFSVNSLKSNHKLNVEVKQNGTWYKVKAETL